MKIKRSAWIVLLSFLPLLFKSQSSGRVIDGIVAVVGSKMIMISDIENQYLQYRAQGNIRGGEAETRCAILEGLLFNKLMLNQADIDSVTVTDKQVDSELDRRIRYFIQQAGSKEKLEEYFKKSLAQIKEEFRDIIREQLLVEMVQHNLTKDVKVTPTEIRTFFKSLPEDSIPMVNAEFVIGQIVKKPKTSLADEIEVKEKLRALRRRVLNGESFATLAILYSEDPGSAAKGGEVGLFGRGELYPEYEAAAFKLKEGEISDIVKTKAGYHIIQLIERRGDFINTRHILITPKVSPEELQDAEKTLDSITELVRKGQMTFEVAVAKFSDDPNKMNGGLMINPFTGNVRFEPDQLEPKVYYVVDKLEKGQISGPVPFKTEEGTDAYRLLYLVERTKPHKANLKDDYDKIQNWALEKKKEETMEKWVKERINKTYISISPEYQNCKFRNSWIKK